MESKATNDSVLFSAIKSAIYQLMEQMDLYLSSGSTDSPASVNNFVLPYSNSFKNLHAITGSSNSPVLTPAVSCPFSLTPRQMKRQLRASAYRARNKNADSVETTHHRNTNFPANNINKIPKPRCHFSRYLQDCIDGKYDSNGNLVRRCLKASSAVTSHTLPSFLIARPPPTPRTFVLPIIFLPPSKCPPCIVSKSYFNPIAFYSDSDSDFDSDSDLESELQSHSDFCLSSPIPTSELVVDCNLAQGSNLDSKFHRDPFVESLDMLMEDTLLPSKQILTELNTHSRNYCKQQHWCNKCGKPEHGTDCDLYCPDCPTHWLNSHYTYNCPKFFTWLLETQPSSQIWYSERSQEI